VSKRKPMLPRISAGHILHPDYERELRAAEAVIRAARRSWDAIESPFTRNVSSTQDALARALDRLDRLTKGAK